MSQSNIPEQHLAPVQRSLDPSSPMVSMAGFATHLPLVHSPRPDSTEPRIARTQASGATTESQAQSPASKVATAAQSEASAQKNTSETTGTTPHSQIDLDELVEKAWQKLMLKVTIERERRGGTRWL
jgi:hypothetical protein